MRSLRTSLIGIAILAVLVLATPSTARATDNTLGYYWANYYVTYMLNTSTLPSGFSTAIDNASAKWSNQTNFSFLRGSNTSSTNWSDSTTHLIWFGAFPSAWNCASSYIACTFVQGTSGYMSDSDTVWDQNDPYTNTCPWWPGAYPDIETVFLHELGHWAPLGHSSDGSAVMTGSYPGCRQQLTQHDIDSMNAIY